jgi:hypothetical protein
LLFTVICPASNQTNANIPQQSPTKFGDVRDEKGVKNEFKFFFLWIRRLLTLAPAENVFRIKH